MIGELLGISPRSLPESGFRGTQVSCPPIQGKAPVAPIGPYVFGRIGGCELPRVAGLRSRGSAQSNRPDRTVSVQALRTSQDLRTRRPSKLPAAEFADRFPARSGCARAAAQPAGTSS
jgi:hypothetical protein